MSHLVLLLLCCPTPHGPDLEVPDPCAAGVALCLAQSWDGANYLWQPNDLCPSCWRQVEPVPIFDRDQYYDLCPRCGLIAPDTAWERSNRIVAPLRDWSLPVPRLYGDDCGP